MSNRQRLILGIATAAIALIVVGVASRQDARAGRGKDVVGTWHCQVIRTDNLQERPWTLIFHADGTAEYSSATNVGAPFIGRAGGFGQWEKVGRKAYSLQVREHMYVADPAAGLALKAGGAWYVDAIFHHDAASDSLCSGPASTGCPESNKILLVKYELDAAGNITGETSLNAGTAWIGECQRLEDVFPTL
jgi:hypothetical protein